MAYEGDLLAQLQATERTRTYPCPSCGGQLAFDPALQQLRCLSCGAAHGVLAPADPTVRSHDLAHRMGELRALQASNGADGSIAERDVVCQSCGGRTTFSGNLVAVRCPYCAVSIQRDDVQNAPVRLPVDAIIPFRVGEAQARELIEGWINARRFAPTEFRKYREVGAFSSLYVTYFVYDAATTTSFTGQQGEDHTETVGEGDQQRTKTLTDWYPRSGVINNQFEGLTVLAGDGMDEARMAALEPWPLDQARPYHPQFVAGHLSRTYDADPEQRLPVARQRMDAAIQSAVRREIGGDRQRIDSLDTRFDRLNFSQLLMPIWLLSVSYEGRPFQVYINGVTGEVQGQRPWSKPKIIAAIAAVVIIIAVIVIVTRLLNS